ncbi:MAG: hypothetical protein RL138_729 [Bacteroidota bacterium]|jgi:SAM-dependent methyltransferase
MSTQAENIEFVPCNLCGASSSTTYYKDGNWSIVKCDVCQHTYTNPRPTASALPSYYTEDYFQDERHKKKFYHADGSPKAVADSYLNRVADVENFCEARGRVLELGAARGAFLKVLQDRGWEVHGVEISADAVALAKTQNNLQIHCGVLEDYQSDLKFDVVCMYQTLEHVLTPDYVCKRSAELLKQGGKLIIEVPNRNCFEMKWSKRRKVLSYDLPRHISHFSPDILAKHLKGVGFSKVHIYYYPDKYILGVFNFIGRIINLVRPSAPAQAANAQTGTATVKQIPMARISGGIMHRALQKISSFIPGWRFTIIAVK